MKNLLTCVRKAVLPLLMGSAVCAIAQSLGTPTADVWLGRPLDMTVPARFLSNETRDECIHADVFFGEARVPADRVRTTVSGTDQQRRVRIVTDLLVDEPIVTVSVRAGCASSITRNYTLLPELPSETMLAQLGRIPTVGGPIALPVAGAAAAVAAPNTSPLRLARSTAPAAAPRSGSLRDVVAQARKAVGAPPAAPEQMRTARAFRKDMPVAGGPRLRLEPVEMHEHAMLRVSSSLAAPDGDAAQRATAALLWQAINADPQELMRTTAMLQKLEGDLVQLRQSATITRNEMAALRRRLDEAQPPWYASAAMVQVLALLVLATGAAAVFLWFRARRAGTKDTWYAPGGTPIEPLAETAAEASPELVVVPEPQPAVRRTEAVPGQFPPAFPAFAAGPVRAAGSADTGRGPIDFEVPVLPKEPEPRRAMVGELRVETLGATLEEVEFLSSLGLSSDAMDVLKGYLHDSVSPAPLAFLELMRLCDEGADATAIGTVRRRYVQAFGMEAPRLEHVTAPIGLDNMPHLSHRITRAWGTPEALVLIEEALFKVPEPGAALTLQAGRDLVCLYDLAMAIATEKPDGDSASDAEGHPLAPWANADDAHGAHAAAQAAAEAHGGDHFALDIDLGAAHEALPDTQSEESQLAPQLAEMQAAAARQKLAQAQQDDEDAFSAAVASERAPVSRY